MTAAAKPTSIVERIREQRAVAVTDRQAAAVLADLVVNLRTMAAAPEVGLAALSQTSPESFRIGFATAIELVEQAVAMHEPTSGGA